MSHLDKAIPMAHTKDDMNARIPHETDCCAAARGPGRPPEMAECERREKILGAADKVLQTYGYQAASMDKVAQCSGMSKRTLYQLFPSKQELFHALIGARLFCFSPCVRVDAATPEDELIGLLQDIAARLIRPEAIELIRAIIASASESEDIRHIMLSLKGGGETNVFKCWLRDYCFAQGHPETDIEQRARQLFGMTVGELMLDALVIKNIDEDDSRAYITSGAQLFLNALHAEWNTRPSV
ncbi:TetR/AcrR family transcriptional regulator [Acetobacter estunensis]|nr:TetR/AcrR family transcriptional regulator [Acetobacter estunensis]